MADDVSNDPNFLMTHEGHRIFLKDMSNNTYDIRDIAAALSKQPRWNGHTSKFYSVAEHSIWVSVFAPLDLKLTGLLHDAAEAYTGDVPRPVRREVGGAFEDLDRRLTSSILDTISGTVQPIPKEIWDLDNRVLVTEATTLFKHKRPLADWKLDHYEPLPFEPHCFAPEDAEMMFLAAYKTYTHSVNN